MAMPSPSASPPYKGAIRLTRMLYEGFRCLQGFERVFGAMAHGSEVWGFALRVLRLRGCGLGLRVLALMFKG